jgi:hypothetical protein
VLFALIFFTHREYKGGRNALAFVFLMMISVLKSLERGS